jgi:pimeloyl-ACP methyl ester carboxylesterase
VDTYVGDMIAVLDFLRIARAALWGYSSGCCAGFALAATHPDRVAALIASGAISSRDYAEPEERGQIERRAALVRQHGLSNNRRAARIMPDRNSVTFKGPGHFGAYLRSDLALSHGVPFVRATCDLRPES